MKREVFETFSSDYSKPSVDLYQGVLVLDQGCWYRGASKPFESFESVCAIKDCPARGVSYDRVTKNRVPLESGHDSVEVCLDDLLVRFEVLNLFER